MDGLVQSTPSMPPVLGSMQFSQECQVFLFGDLTVSFEEDLRLLLHVKDNATLCSFFEQVSFAFRAECAKLPSHQQAWFPHFTTIVDLLSKLGKKEGAPALRFALLCLCEIGQFIRYILVTNPFYPDFGVNNDSLDILEKDRDRFLVLLTASWWPVAQDLLLLLQSAPLKHFLN